VQKIFHLAALLSSPCEDHPYRGFKVNVEGTVNVLEVCRLFGVNKLLFPSSVSTFGPDASEPVEEASPQHPTNIYGVTKVVGEKWGIYYWHKHGIDFRAIRFPRIVNPGRQGTGAALFPSSMIQKAALGELHQEEVSQDYRIPLLYVKDAVEALLLLDKGKDVLSRIYNMEGLLPTAKEIAEILKQRLPKAQINFPEKVKPIHLKIPLHFASEKIKKELGWQIKYPLREMIEDFVKEAQTRKQLYVDNQE
jgi:nucleoside-diphosphate-sugar epimerase